ncbi:hypothetical protein M422DRAFT_37945 [Sphaerobolus stellatus SS14]|uniref:Nudix hydrolase domain-containing protein n=1 Tax=Sphaerobolus stellatus (strain SS14) TaxID=990650 RepID=A0A0C9UD72_SPHS4|nr:hypothetical protein M422DRAFT_37945 [Sphaerobolus stellatus SS14]
MEPTPSLLPTFDQPMSEIRLLYLGKRLVVGVAIVRNFSEEAEGKLVQKRKLLILQRSATEDAYPFMYEIPGGHVEEEDNSLFATVRRETLEETGLIVKRITGEFEGFEYETKKGITVQLNFFVEVEPEGDAPPQVQINPEEHQAYAWVSLQDNLEAFPMTSSMTAVVNDALKLMQDI